MHVSMVIPAMLSLAVLALLVPAYADVNSVEFNKEKFGIKDKFAISGTVTDPDRVTLLASMKGPAGEKLTRTTISDHDSPTFSFVPVRAEELFESRGTYTVNVFTENQRPQDGTTIRLEYANSMITVLPDYTLLLHNIESRTVSAGQTVSFTADLTDPAVRDERFSLQNGPPQGASIDSDTGKFTWTPAARQVGSYLFDVVVNAGPLEDRQTIQIDVHQASTDAVAEPEPGPELTAASPPPVPAAFVDVDRDPNHYIKRYTTEPAYQKWFDENYPEYDSIYHAVGMDAPPRVPAAFVDVDRDPNHYIKRYTTEPAYQKWFDENYPEYDSIYHAVGLEEPAAPAEPAEPKAEPETKVPQEYGYCGAGTKLSNGVCVVETAKPWWQFW